MSFMTSDCVFESSAGDNVCGTRYVGTDPVRAGFSKAWESLPDANGGDAHHFVRGDRGVSEPALETDARKRASHLRARLSAIVG